jgi:cytochrome bd-type quinol oxidase subunit 1
MKLAAMEGLYKGQKSNGLVLIGIPQPGKKPRDGQNDFSL